MQSISYSVTCDICGAGVGLRGGAYVDLHKHDRYQTMLTTNPPQYPGRLDLCDRCRDELAVWINEKKSEAGR